ncbi:MAG: DUF929 domain-containing protein [Candidatus Marsarchaeota archaeon]|nr:DUF929 domain-containing protein [Candidatus Marsarchaeota archaeon]
MDEQNQDRNQHGPGSAKPIGAHGGRRGNRKLLYAAFILIAVLVIADVLVTQQNSQLAKLVKYDNVAVPASLMAQLSVPGNISNRIGIGTADYSGILNIIHGSHPLSAGGKPELLFIGADYCPYCAAERWAIVIALMRFGNFSNLHLMTSSANDYSPSTPTFTFYNSTYTSPYIAFVGVETYTNQPSGSFYKPLQQPTQEQLALMSHNDPNETVPYMLLANYSYVSGALYDPYSILYGKNWSTIIDDIYNTSSAQSQSIIGSANLLTEQICSIDNNTPAGVCSQPYVTDIRKIIGS